MKDFGSQEEALAAPLCSLGIGICSDGIDAAVDECVAASGQLCAAARDVFVGDDAGGGGGDSLAEEGAVEHLHGAVHWRREHVGG